MRIKLDDFCWKILIKGRNRSKSLALLALKHGYRIAPMAEELDFSERYFHEIFLRDVGITPKQWLMRERMVVACRMLAGGRTDEQVSKMIGFSSKHNFRREFLKHYQVSPKQYQLDRWQPSRNPIH